MEAGIPKVRHGGGRPRQACADVHFYTLADGDFRDSDELVGSRSLHADLAGNGCCHVFVVQGCDVYGIHGVYQIADGEASSRSRCSGRRQLPDRVVPPSTSTRGTMDGLHCVKL